MYYAIVRLDGDCSGVSEAFDCKLVSALDAAAGLLQYGRNICLSATKRSQPLWKVQNKTIGDVTGRLAA
jgi:hypothetical protein